MLCQTRTGARSVKSQRATSGNQELCRSRFHLDRKFGHVAKTFGGIGSDRSTERSLKPRRQVWAKSGEELWSISAGSAGGVRIAIRELAGEGAEDGDAQGIYVSGLVAGFTSEHLRCHVPWGTWNVLGQGIF